MNYPEAIKSNNILKTILVLCILLIVSVWIIYRPFAWPLGREAAFCLLSVILISSIVYILWTKGKVKEWSDLKESSGYSDMSVYFAYQTFTGALGHLFVLGIAMGLILGTIGGLLGKSGRRLLR